MRLALHERTFVDGIGNGFIWSSFYCRRFYSRIFNYSKLFGKTIFKLLQDGGFANKPMVSFISYNIKFHL